MQKNIMPMTDLVPYCVLYSTIIYVMSSVKERQ